MAVTPGLSFGRAMGMTQAATAVPTTAPTVGPAIGVSLTDGMLWCQGSLRSPGAGGAWRWPCGGCRGLDKAVASQQGRRVGLSWPVGRAMNLPADESTSATSQRLQQGAGGRLRLDLGGSR
jgi:hypothetical protein